MRLSNAELSGVPKRARIVLFQPCTMHALLGTSVSSVMLDGALALSVSASTRFEPAAYAAFARFSLMILGWRAAILSNASAGPSGLLRPCSQLRKV